MFVWCRLPTLGVAAFLVFVCEHHTVEAQSYVDRSKACVALIKRLNPATHIQSGLVAAKCPLGTPDSAFTGVARHTWLASGAACNTELEEVPACGLTKNYLDVFPKAVRRIDLGDGKCLHVLPVMLSDKKDGFKCNAVKARPACIAGVRREGGSTIVTLAGGTEPGALRADVIVPPEPKHHVPLIAKSQAGPLMALVPADVTISGDPRDSQGFLQHHVNYTLAACTGSNADCREQAGYQADRAVGELLRRVWNPRPLVPSEERKADFKRLIDRMLSADLGRNEREKKLFAKLIIENEVSASSPYQVLDAVIRNSGISWGAHQIDIGANEPAEVSLFWDTLRRWRQSPGTGDYPKLRQADALRACLSQPIRNYFVDHIALYFGALPDMNKGLRSEQGKASYDARFKAYLDEEISLALALKGLFKKSPFAWLYFADQRNQRGPGAGEELRRIGVAIRDAELSSCSGIATGEQRLVEYIKSTTARGEHYDIDRRVDNLKRLLSRELGTNLGRSCRE
jgi:hypothetical protein